MKSEFKREPCRTDHKTVPREGVIQLDDWRRERALEPKDARERAEQFERELRRKMRARERAEIQWRRRQMPWPLRVLAGLIDLVREWRGR